jgi:dUTPase
MKILVKKERESAKEPIWVEDIDSIHPWSASSFYRLKVFSCEEKLIEGKEEELISTGISLLWPEGLMCYVVAERGPTIPVLKNKSIGSFLEVAKEIKILFSNPHGFPVQVDKEDSLCDLIFAPAITGFSLAEDFLGDFSSSFLNK